MSALRQIEAKAAAAVAAAPTPVVGPAGAPSLTASPQTTSAPKLASLCAGINGHDVENERVSQERSSDPS
jgi:hypothetical protein